MTPCQSVFRSHGKIISVASFYVPALNPRPHGKASKNLPLRKALGEFQAIHLLPGLRVCLVSLKVKLGLPFTF